jgi:hypothetical protein
MLHQCSVSLELVIPPISYQLKSPRNSIVRRLRVGQLYGLFVRSIPLPCSWLNFHLSVIGGEIKMRQQCYILPRKLEVAT